MNNQDAAEHVEKIIRRIKGGAAWTPQPESAGHLRGWLLTNLETLAIALRRRHVEPPILTAPGEITVCRLECVVMPNGEVICAGKTVGWVTTHGKYLTRIEAT